MKELILVDEQDREIGYGEKMSVHRSGKLHRAFSVFIFDMTHHLMLIQKRADEKYHSGGLWSNACCSHPYRSETWAEALSRAMSDELGIHPCLEAPYFSDRPDKEKEDSRGRNNSLYHCGSFHYSSDYGNISENEIDHVFLYLPGDAEISSISPVPSEVSALRWMSVPELESRFEEEPGRFTSWFANAYDLAAALLDIVSE